MLDGVFVSGKNVLASCKRAYEHEKGRFGRVKVRKHLVNDFKLKTRIHKNARCPRARAYNSVFIGGSFKSTDARSADRKDWATVFFRAIDFFRCVFGNGKNFFVHFVVFDIVFAHGKKRSKPHVQGKPRKVDSLRFQPLKHFACKMQSGSRTRGTSRIGGIHVLIALAVFRTVGSFYVRRQRNMPVLLKPFFRNGHLKFHRADFRSGVARLFYNRSDAAVRKCVSHSGLLLFCVVNKRIPFVALCSPLIQKDEFLPSPC